MKKMWMTSGIALTCAATFVIYNHTADKPSVDTPTLALHDKHDTVTKKLPKMTTPQRFIVPSLGISSAIINVGLTETGDMATPPDNTTLGWYENNAMPGNPGAAVLAAHAGPPNNPSVFQQLATLEKDNIVQIEDEKSTKATFKVTEITTYTPDSAPRQRIFGATTAAKLAIVTCTGQWSANSQTYSHRLVVYAVRKS